MPLPGHSLSLRGIKARPHDLKQMLTHKPSLVEMHCSVDDLRLWDPRGLRLDVPLAVHLPEYFKGSLIDPASLDETARYQAQDLYTSAVQTAAMWGRSFTGRPKVVFHPGGMSVEPFTKAQRDDARAQLDKTIAAMLRVAGDGVEVLVENLPRNCCFFGGNWLANLATDAVDMASICQAHKIGMTLDLCHLYLAGQAQGFSLVDSIAHLKPFVRHVHYSGASGVDGEGLALSDPESGFDVAKLLGPLRDLPIVAVPEIWFGHENGGAGFVKAWADAEHLIDQGATWPR